MKENKAVRLSVRVLILLGILFGLFSGVFILVRSEAGTMMKIFAAASLSGFVMALFYLWKGYGKKEANFYKAYMILFSVIELVAAVCSRDYEARPVLAVVLSMAAYIAVLTVAMAVNLGKDRSRIAWGVNFVIHVLFFVGALMVVQGVLRGGTMAGTLQTMRAADGLTLSAVMGILVEAKYRDKDSRGTV